MKLNKLIIVSVSALILFSCKKNVITGVDDVTYSGAKMVSFNNYEGYQKINLTLGNNFVPVEYEIKLANTTGTANGPITVKLIKDDNAVYEYNTINGTALSPVPITAYKFEQTEVVIAKGARTATVHFEINPSKLSGGSSAFGISIFSVSGDGAVVHSDNSQTHLVVELSALNQYDGIYSLKGTALRAGDAALSGTIPTYEMPLVTVTATAVEFDDLQHWADGSNVGIGYPKLDVNPSTNAVTVSADPITPPLATPLGNAPGYNNRYDPATKTFYISFTWNAGPTQRLATDTLKYLRPR